ncbi:hypothetical protein [Intrasporangium sp. YIM S08009]|uniref:DUF7144 family membrane protein n=1 Tax=Intrasporangium zincisolvens TaxID=3080018 RepID=UPI002B05FF0C|nr:hypothetical protein [Intrasporangium sp. YIM S08009]
MTSQPSSTKLEWAAGLTVFAGLLLITAGLFQALGGITALVNDQRYVLAGAYVYTFDVTTWGWIQLVLGLAALGLGIAVIVGKVWSLIVAVAVAILSATAQFMWLPYDPVRAIVVIAINAVIVWALAVQLKRP